MIQALFASVVSSVIVVGLSTSASRDQKDVRGFILKSRLVPIVGMTATKRSTATTANADIPIKLLTFQAEVSQNMCGNHSKSQPRWDN